MSACRPSGATARAVDSAPFSQLRCSGWTVSWDTLSRDPVYKVDRCGAVVFKMRAGERDNDGRCIGHRRFQEDSRHQHQGRRKASLQEFREFPRWLAPVDRLAHRAQDPTLPCLPGGNGALQPWCCARAAPSRSRRQHRQSRPDPRLYAQQAGAQQGVDAAHIREYAELFKPPPWTPPSPALRRLGELQTIRAGLVAGLTEWKNRNGSGIVDETARSLAEATILHFTTQLQAVDRTITETIEGDPGLRGKWDLLLSISGVGEILAGILLAELPGPDMLRSSAEVVAYAGLNPRRHQSGTSVDRPTRISKVGNAVLRAALFMPAMSAMRHNPVVAALAARLKIQGRLKGKQIVVAAMRKLLVLCFGVLKSGKRFDPAIAMAT